MSLPHPRRFAAASLGFFRYRPIDGRVLLTNAVGEWAFITRAEFLALLEGRLDPASESHRTLAKCRIVRSDAARAAEATDFAPAMRQRLAPLFRGPSHAALVLTTREHLDGGGDDMGRDMAERAVDCAFMTTSPRLTLELVGGEPLAVPGLVRHIVDYARKKNMLARKYLGLRLHTTLEGLDDATLGWLADERIQLTARAHGSPGVHDAVARGAASARLDALGHWLPRIRKAYLDSGVPAPQAHAVVEVRVSDVHAGRGADTIAALTRLGAGRISLSPYRPLHGANANDRSGLAPSAYRTFVEDALASLAALPASATAVESTIAHVMRRVVGQDVPSDTRWRAPGLDGIGELATGPDGITCAGLDGYALHASGDDAFALAHVARSGYHDIVAHPTVRALVVASALEGHPEWATHAYAPYLATWPVATYAEQGSIHGRLRESAAFQRQIALFDAIFSFLAQPDSLLTRMLYSWASDGDTATAFYE